MDKAKEAISRLDGQSLVVLQIEVLKRAVEALIATHPNPTALRADFDRLYAMFQGTASMMANPDASAVARALAEKLFEGTQQDK